jgi:hypothetical protein
MDLTYTAVYRYAFSMQIGKYVFTCCINFKDYKSAAIIVSFYSCNILELKYRQNIYVKYHIYAPQTQASSL